MVCLFAWTQSFLLSFNIHLHLPQHVFLLLELLLQGKLLLVELLDFKGLLLLETLQI